MLIKQRNRLSGDVNIAVPVAWQAIGLLIFGGILAGFIFLSFARFSRVETTTGVIAPDAGVSSIFPSRAGVISALAVRDGQIVDAGAILATIRAEEDGATAQSPAAQVEGAIAQQDASLSAQVSAAQASAAAQASQLGAQRSGLIAEIAQLQAQMKVQRALIKSAQKDIRPLS